MVVSRPARALPPLPCPEVRPRGTFAATSPVVAHRRPRRRGRPRRHGRPGDRCRAPDRVDRCRRVRPATELRHLRRARRRLRRPRPPPRRRPSHHRPLDVRARRRPGRLDPDPGPPEGRAGAGAARPGLPRRFGQPGRLRRPGGGGGGGAVGAALGPRPPEDAGRRPLGGGRPDRQPHRPLLRHDPRLRGRGVRPVDGGGHRVDLRPRLAGRPGHGRLPRARADLESGGGGRAGRGSSVPPAGPSRSRPRRSARSRSTPRWRRPPGGEWRSTSS